MYHEASVVPWFFFLAYCFLVLAAQLTLEIIAATLPKSARTAWRRGQRRLAWPDDPWWWTRVWWWHAGIEESATRNM